MLAILLPAVLHKQEHQYSKNVQYLVFPTIAEIITLFFMKQDEVYQPLNTCEKLSFFPITKLPR